jgi:predicted membrane-bound spermidine synthase
MYSSRKVYDYLNSFFNEKVIETFRSEFNPELEVTYINGRYQLDCGNVNYSFGPLHDAFRKYFRRDPPKLDKRSSILILGFGAGSAASILREEHDVQNRIVGVEIDPAVLEAARKHFYLDKFSNIEIVTSDAFSYLESNLEKHELIVIDLYLDDKIPPKFETAEFINLAAKHLVIGGKLVFNKLVLKKGDEQSLHALINIFQNTFDTMEVVKVNVSMESPNCFITGIINK